MVLLLAIDILILSSSSSSIDSKVIKEIQTFDLKWLCAMIPSAPFNCVSYLASHRDFHNYSDLCVIQPIEDSFLEYKEVYTPGVHLCKRDIFLEK